jgi:hypothetical protein
MVCESSAITYTDTNQQAPSQPMSIDNTTQQRYRDSPGAVAGVIRWVFSHGCALLFFENPALMGWYDECKYDKATAFASYKYDLLRRLSTSSAYALSHAVYESPQRPPKWMWGSSYVSVYTAGDYQSPPDGCVLDIDRILAQQMQCGEDRQGMPAIIHAGSLPGSRIPPSSSDEWSDGSGDSSDEYDEIPELEPSTRRDWRYLLMVTARFKCIMDSRSINGSANSERLLMRHRKICRFMHSVSMRCGYLTTMLKLWHRTQRRNLIELRLFLHNTRVKLWRYLVASLIHGWNQRTSRSRYWHLTLAAS